MIGILEVGIGVGLLTGPLLGTLLYKYGGYSCPFWTLGLFFLLMFPLLAKMLRLTSEVSEESDQNEKSMAAGPNSTIVEGSQLSEPILGSQNEGRVGLINSTYHSRQISTACNSTAKDYDKEGMKQSSFDL